MLNDYGCIDRRIANIGQTRRGAMLRHRKALGALMACLTAAFLQTAAATELPDGYIRLNYIESPLKQCIHTGYIPTYGDKIECDVKVAYISDSSSSFALFGFRDGEGKANRYYFRFMRDATQAIGFGTDDYYLPRTGEYFRDACKFLSGYDGGYRVHVTMQSNKVEWVRHDGTMHGSIVAPADVTPPTMSREICLFGVNHMDNKWISFPTKLRLYSFKVTSESGTVMCDFVPCRRNSDGAIGLYDVVRGLFRENESTASGGTGPFIAGPLYGSMPLGYRKAKYIQSTSDGQYIDTGYLVGTNDLVKMDYYAPKTWQTGGYCHLFGAWIGGSTYTSAENFWFYIGGNGADYISYNHYTSKSGTSSAVGYDYTCDPIHLECQARTATWSSGSMTNSLTTTATFADWIAGRRPLFIFTSNANGSPYNTTLMRLYSFKIYRDIDGEMVPVHDYIPCVSDSGAAGLYDKIGDRFHGNARSGAADFVVGPVCSSLPDGYKKAKYIQSTSALQYIDTRYWHGTNDLVVADYHALKTWQVKDYCYLWGSRMPSSGNHTHAVNWSFYIGGRGQNRVNYNHHSSKGDDNPTAAVYNYADDPIHLECQASTAKWTCGDVTNSFTTTSTSANWTDGKWPLYIFTGDCGGSPEYNYSTVMRLYTFKIYRDINGRMVLVRDFLPCVEASTGKAGLYDLVEERFYGNARSGVADFIAGGRGFMMAIR